MKKMKILISLLFLLLLVSCGKVPFDAITSIPDLSMIPKFVDHDFVNLNMIEKISKFRSGYGHSFTDGFEYNRSMKHYYAPYVKYLGDAETIPIYSPVNGIICDKFPESDNRENDWQIHIVPDGYLYVMICLFHVNTKLQVGNRVVAGERIGYANTCPTEQDKAHGFTYSPDFDISVQITTRNGVHLISWFQIMTDSLFESYKKRGITERSDFIISKEWRDAHPITSWEGSSSDWVVLSPPPSE